MAYRLTKTFGGKGTGPGEFDRPLAGMAVDPRGRLFVSSGKSIQVFEPGGAPVARWPATMEALCVAAGPRRTIFVGHDGAVCLHDETGRLLSTWRDSDHLGVITSIAPAPGCVYLADARARVIRRCSPEGKWLNDLGGDNPTRGFHIPNGALSCAVDAQGVLHAANPGKHRVERYSAEGKLLSKVGRFDQLDPAGFPGCCNPCTLALDRAGNLYVSEKAPPRIKVLDPSGRLMAVVATTLLDPMARNCPIAVDARGVLFAGDPVRCAIHRFEAAS